MSLDELKRRYPWPEACPNVPPNPTGWFGDENRTVLRSLIGEAGIVLELGAWLGMSTRFLLENTPGVVITVDHWQGSPEHTGMPELVALWETFVRNCWDHRSRSRLIPMRTRTLDGMRELHELGIVPDVIYVDADHERESVAADVREALTLFPRAHLVGDDWTWDSVRAGVFQVMTPVNGPGRGRMLVGRTTCYEILPQGVQP